MAHRIAEAKDVKLPLMVCQDGFITSHSIENIELLEDDIKQEEKKTKEQKEFEKALEIARIPHAVCKSPFEATQFVKKIMEE